MSRDSRDGSYAALVTDPPLVVVAAITFVAVIGFEAASPALPTIADSFGVSPSRVGLVMTAFSVPMVLFVPVTGVLADVYGRRRVIIPSLLLYGGAGVAVAGAGALVIPPAAGFLAESAWNYPFLLHALAFPAAALAYRYVPETATGTGTAPGVVDTLRGYGRGIRAELVDPDLALLIAGGFVRGFVRIAVVTFVPLFAVRALGSSLLAAGAVLSARGVARLVIPPVSGPVVDSLSRKWGLLLALSVSAASAAVIPFAPAIVWVGVLIGLYTAGDALFSPILKEADTSAATDDHRAGVVNTMYVFQYGGEAVAPVFFGAVLAVVGFGAVFSVAGATVALYALAVAVFLSGR